MFAVPPLISWLTSSTGSFGTIARFLGFGAQPTWSISGLAGLIAAVAAVAKYCQAGLAKWNALGGQAKGNAAAGGPGLPATVGGWLRQLLLPWVPVIIALVIMLLTRVVANANSLSMHDFYRWRLADGFASPGGPRRSRTRWRRAGCSPTPPPPGPVTEPAGSAGRPGGSALVADPLGDPLEELGCVVVHGVSAVPARRSGEEDRPWAQVPVS